MSENIRLPEWRIGTHWVVRVRQLAFWLRTSTPRWVGPIHLSFEVTEANDENYRLLAKFLNQTDRHGETSADIRLRRSDLHLIEGTLRINDLEVPMEYDIVAQILKQHPPGVDLAGMEGEERRMLGPEEPIVLKTFTIVTASGGTRVSSPELPFHLRILEDEYTVELISWHL